MNVLVDENVLDPENVLVPENILDPEIVLLDVKPTLVAIKFVIVVLKLASLLIAADNSDNVLSKSGLILFVY